MAMPIVGADNDVIKMDRDVQQYEKNLFSFAVITRLEGSELRNRTKAVFELRALWS